MSKARATAYHEAGHAVAGLIVGYHLYSVTIIPEPGRLGYTSARGSGGPDDWRFEYSGTREAALASIFYSGAGPAAQSRYSREALAMTWLFGGSADDLNASLRWAKLYHPSMDAALKAVWHIWGRTSVLIRRGPAWQAVAAVAEALLIAGTLEGPEVERLVQAAWPDRPDELDVGNLPTLTDCLRLVVAA